MEQISKIEMELGETSPNVLFSEEEENKNPLTLVIVHKDFMNRMQVKKKKTVAFNIHVLKASSSYTKYPCPSHDKQLEKLQQLKMTTD